MAEAHAVEARQVRRRFGRRDDVVRGHGQMDVLELDALQLRAELLELGERGANCRGIVGIEARVEEALGHADRDAVPRLVDELRVARHRLVERRRVARIESGHRFEQQRRVLGRLREHAGLVEARCERDHAVARHASVRRLEAGDAGRARPAGESSRPCPCPSPRARCARRPPRRSRPTSRPARARDPTDCARVRRSSSRSRSPSRTRPCSSCRA